MARTSWPELLGVVLAESGQCVWRSRWSSVGIACRVGRQRLRWDVWMPWHVTQSPPEMVGISAWHRKPPDEPFAPNIPIAALPMPRTSLYWSWHMMRRPSIQRAAGEVDVIHATGMAVPPHTAPLAVTVNDLAFLRHPDHFTARGMQFFARSLELTRNDADVVVCPSQHTADDCVRAGIEAERVRLVPYGVDDCFVPENEAEEVRRRLELTDRFVLWVGTAEPRKNVDGLVQAWKMLGRTDEELVLVGPEGWKSNLDVGLPTSIRRLGFVSEADKRALMRAAAVFCYPSLTEGFGLPVLEAMAQGTPVVTSAIGATAELAGPAGVLVDPTQPRQIAEALAGLLDHVDEADRLGKQGRGRALSEFTWARTAEGLMQIYRELAP